MNDFVFVSVAFCEAYVAQQDRLRESILSIYPDANIMFWRDELPQGSRPFLDSLYGFKVHAIAEAKKKYQKVLWLDPAMILCDKVDVLFSHKIAIVKDDNMLYNLVSDNALKYFGILKSDIQSEQIHLVGGSLYYFDFDSVSCEKAFNDWYAAELMGIFGSQAEEASEQLQGHRADETCMALCLYQNNINPISGPDIGYCIEKKPVFIKKHFK